MIALLLATLLQAPDDLATFLDALEKDRAKGVAAQELLKRIDAWAAGKPEDVLAQLAWNRTTLAASDRLETLFIDGLKKRIGKEVKLGPSSGILREVKSDRLILGVAGGTIDVMLSTVTPEVRLNDLKKESLLPKSSLQEALFLFAAVGKTAPALAMARALKDSASKDAAFAAFAGKVLQDIDRGLAKGPLLKVAEDLAATWAKEEETLGASGGALRKRLDGDIATRLFGEAEKLLPTNRPSARRHLDLVSILARDPAVLKEARAKKWKYLASGEWHAIPLEAIVNEEVVLSDSKIVLEMKEKNSWSDFMIKEVTVPWEEVSGVRMKFRPGTTKFVHFRLISDDEETQHTLSLVVNEAWAWYAKRTPSDQKTTPIRPTELTKKAEYELRAESEGKSWKFFVDKLWVNTFDFAGPKSIRLLADSGKAEMTTFEIRKK